ncbi:MAG: SDR family oxidoreductase [Gammaproteobacteria bacterium]|nr:SDR family oxidoreductase [Gammaproteobacteria bacterium]
MKVLIIGATGTIGRELVSQALARGHEVTAFARDPSKLSPAAPASTVAQGDALDPASIESHMPRHDAVVIALGAGSQGRIRSQGTQHVIQAMKNHGVRRLVCLSSLGVGESSGNLNFFWKYIMFGLLLRRAFADHVLQEEYVRQSGLDWTIVRPGAYTDGELTKSYRHGFPADARGLKLKVSRADVAHFMLEQLDDDRYHLKSPGISY